MTPSSKIVLLLCFVALAVSACVTPFQLIDQTTPTAHRTYRVLGPVKGESCFSSLLHLFPLRTNRGLHEAYRAALRARESPADALIEVTVDIETFDLIVYQQTCTVIRGKAIAFTDGPRTVRPVATPLSPSTTSTTAGGEARVVALGDDAAKYCEWIRNPSAEPDGTLDGWTAKEGEFHAVQASSSTPPATDGSWSFAAGPVERAVLSQAMKLPDLVRTRRTFAVLRGSVRNWSGADQPSLRLVTRDADGQVLVEQSSESGGPEWRRFEIRLEIPANADRIDVELRSVRKVGGDNDGYFDDIELCTYSDL